MDMNDIITRMNAGTLSEDERNVLLAALGGTKVRKAAATGPKVPTPGLKISCSKFPVTYTTPSGTKGEPDVEVTIPGAYREVWYVTSPMELVPGTKHYVATRKSTPSETNKTPWPPQYIQIMGYIGQRTLDDGSQLYTYTYDRLASDGTKRVTK